MWAKIRASLWGPYSKSQPYQNKKDKKGKKSYNPVKVSDCWSSGTGDKTYIICHVITQDHVIFNHPAKFSDQRHCNSEDILFLI